MTNDFMALYTHRRRKLLLSYIPDWYFSPSNLLCIILSIFRIITIGLAAVFFSFDHIEGYRRVFSLTDSSIRHPYTQHERVPNFALYILCAVAPFIIQTCLNLITIRSWWDFHNSTLGLVLGLALTGSVTQVVKVTVGRPRPDILDRCQPPPGSSNPEFGLASWQICTTTDNSLLRDGFRSFPSGHSSSKSPLFSSPFCSCPDPVFSVVCRSWLPCFLHSWQTPFV